MRRVFAITVVLGVLSAACLEENVRLEQEDELGVAGAALRSASGPKVYIVKYRDDAGDVDDVTDDVMGATGAREVHRYRHALRGAALLVESGVQLADLKADPRVAMVVPDRGFQAAAAPPQTVPAGVVFVGAEETENEGEGVKVAVLDSGIDLDHADLVENLRPEVADCVGDGTTRRRPGNDPHGHGTHVSGIISAVDNAIGVKGVANRVELVSVRVLDRGLLTTETSLLCGIDWVAEHADRVKVANLSLAGPADPPGVPDPLHDAIAATTAAGVTFIAAAGNEADDAANWAPASYDEVITVSAYYVGENRFASFSNYGPDVDLAAPGVYVYSTWKNNRYRLESGTSMAAPHVAAAAAMYISTHPRATPAQVRAALIAAGRDGYPGQDPLHPEPMLDVRGF